MSDTKLKPCPFCGEHLERCGTPRFLYQHPYSKNGCFLRGRVIGKTDIAAWNTRKPMERIVEQIHNAGGCDGTCDYDKGWDDAIAECEDIIRKEGEEGC